jgi:hypothetical protein
MSPAAIRKPSRSNKKKERRVAIEKAKRQAEEPRQLLGDNRERRPHMAQEFEEAGHTNLIPELTTRLRPWAAESAVGMTPSEFYRKHGESIA